MGDRVGEVCEEASPSLADLSCLMLFFDSEIELLMEAPFAEEFAEGDIVGMGNNVLAQTEAAGHEEATAFLLDDDVDAAHVVVVLLNVDIAADELHAFRQLHAVVVELGDGAALHVRHTGGDEERGVDVEASFLVGQGDADKVVGNGVGLPG